MSTNNLFRSKSSRVVAGVCGGLGKYFSMDPVIWRVIFILLSLVGMSGVLIYIILWIALPDENDYIIINDNPQSQTIFSGENGMETNGALWGGIILILLGVMFLIDKFIPTIHFGDIWPVLLIIGGILLVHNAYKNINNNSNSDNNQTF
jgi:phage shock protein PspC (stress-responsive transcriptional regulator)